MLSGKFGPGVSLAMRVVTTLARTRGAERLVAVESAHIDSCLFHGQASLDFAQRLHDLGARCRVPTTLNVGSLDLLHPGLVRTRTDQERETALGGRKLMNTYQGLGARPTWTCAPYQMDSRPELGSHVAWAESNAIVFANSVLGARTDRYGDFLDICASVTGRAPLAGLHIDEARYGQVVFDCTALSGRVLGNDLAFPLLGYLAGKESGTRNPVFVGLPESTSEDQLKALGAAAASSGGVAMFHVVGVTPEAPTLDAALGGRAPEQTVPINAADLVRARNALCTVRSGHLDAVSIGTPHASLLEMAELARVLRAAGRVHPSTTFYLSTGRSVLAEAESLGIAAELKDAGVVIVADTCTYVTSILEPKARIVMTNSGKWAHYAPANLGVDVVLASLEECVRSAVAGKVVLDDAELGM